MPAKGQAAEFLALIKSVVTLSCGGDWAESNGDRLKFGASCRSTVSRDASGVVCVRDLAFTQISV